MTRIRQTDEFPFCGFAALCAERFHLSEIDAKIFPRLRRRWRSHQSILVSNPAWHSPAADRAAEPPDHERIPHYRINFRRIANANSAACNGPKMVSRITNALVLVSAAFGSGRWSAET